MAKLNITLDQDEILSLLEQDRDGAFLELMRGALNGILRAESERQLHAAPSERTPERTDYRNGTRTRTLRTRIGAIELDVPRHRNTPFRTLVFDNYQRSEAALVATMAQMVVEGVSTRKVAAVVEQLCGQAPSKSQVSEVCARLDGDVEKFRSRPLPGRVPFLSVDATYFKVRGGGRVSSRALLVACALDGEGARSVLAFDVCDTESEASWSAFLAGLRERGLKDPLVVVSDAHEGLGRALRGVFPGSAWQRCQFHFSRNVSDKVPVRYRPGVRAELAEMFGSDTLEQARERCRAIADEYREVAEGAVRCLEDGFESAMTVMALPKGVRRYLRTNNHLERLNKELKRRSKVIGVFPNEASLVRMMGSVLIEQDGMRRRMRAAYGKDTYEAIMRSDAPARLAAIAKEQHDLAQAG